MTIFDARHELVWTIPRTFQTFYSYAWVLADVAAGPAGTFVLASADAHRVVDDTLLTRVARFEGFTIALGAGRGGVLMVNYNMCPLRGVQMWQPGQTKPAFAGDLDLPPLEGPIGPARVAAADGVMILHDPYLGGAGGTHVQPSIDDWVFNYLTNPQSVQRWPRRAVAPTPPAPESQFGSCVEIDLDQNGYPLVDVAVDGGDVFVANAFRIERHQAGLPAADWLLRVNAGSIAGADVPLPFLTRLDAQDGIVAALDVGMGEVVIARPPDKKVQRWRFGAPSDGNALPIDIALWAGGTPDQHRVYVADRGRNRVTAFDLDGRRVGEWQTHDGPLSLAVGPDGDVFVLGRGGWGLRYAPDGRLRAYWRVPDLTVEARDIDVDDDGAVYVIYAKVSPPNAVTQRRQILDGGIWIFAPATGSPEHVNPPQPGQCLISRTKSAAPARVPLGSPVDVTLAVTGACPGKTHPVQVALVVDTSGSMGDRSALRRAQDSAIGMIAEMDAEVTQAALATFGDGAALRVPLTGDLQSVASSLLRLDANGDTRMAAGIDIAQTELTGPRARPGERRVMLLITDGIPKDAPLDAAAAARQAGIEIYALIFPSDDLTTEQLNYLMQMVGGNSDHFLFNPAPALLSAFTRDLTRFEPESGMFRTLTVVDVIPDNMAFVPGSDVPPAARQGQTLTWTLADVAAAAPPVLRYRLLPQEVGIWPTNVEAIADYVDAAGVPGRVRFPVPTVEVLAPTPTPTSRPTATATPLPRRFIYLPIALKSACNPVFLPQDIVLVLDTSSSMLEPAVGGGTKLQAARGIARRFAGATQNGNRVGIVTFDHAAHVVAGLTKDRSALSAAIDGIESAPGTRIDLGLAEARAMFESGGRPGVAKVAILLTDGGQPGGEGAVLSAADAIKAAGATVYAIGLGGNADGDLLRAVASSAQTYYPSPTGGELTAIYFLISANLGCAWP